MDKKDWKILNELCQDARLSHSQIAKRVGLSKNGVTYRIERLQKRGVITGYFGIVDYTTLDLLFFEVLVAGRDKEFIEKCVQNPHILTFDRLSGEWDYVLQFGCRNIQQLYDFLEGVETYEVHPIREMIRTEQLPVELVTKTIQKRTVLPLKMDAKDYQLLHLLDQDATLPLYKLGNELGLTGETIATRLKKLRKSGILAKTTARVSLNALGYDVFLIMLDVRSLSDDLRRFIKTNKHVRFAFLSAATPKILVYFATKTMDELDTFLHTLTETFPNEILNKQYLLNRQQYKYQLFPAGLLLK